MRVLFSSTPAYGHVFPMVPLARACLEAGHDVLWATGGQACELVQAAGIEAVAAGHSSDGMERIASQVRRAGAEVLPADRARFTYPRLFGEGLTPAMVADLLPLARSFRPDVLVHEHGELGAPLVGAVLDVPSVTHSFGGAIPAEFVADASGRLGPLWTEHGRDVAPYAGCFTSTYLDICPPSVQSVSMAHLPSVQPMRPVSWTGRGSDWVAPPGDRPLVYVTLGTVRHDVNVLRAVVAGLTDLPVRVLVTVGPDGDPAALGRQPEHVTVERFVPQTQVLPHCAVVVSHGGSGTFLGTLALGLPQLCVPQAADQFRNAAGGVASGAALALPPGQATPEAIAESVGALLREDRYRMAARRVAAEIAGLPSPAEVVPVLAALT